jgi:hypothetical protein
MRDANAVRTILGSLIAACVVAACTTSVKPSSSTGKQASNAGDRPTANGGAPDNQTSPGTLGGGASSPSSCAGGSGPGCPCSAGATVACWTGPSEDRNVGACHDGTQSCVSSGVGENVSWSWGPCQGEELECGQQDSGAPPVPASADAGVDSAPAAVVSADAGSAPTAAGDAGGFLVSQNASVGGGTSPCSVECTGCVPGAVIGCYDDCNLKAYCDTTATETCLPNGTWGPCTETGGATGKGGQPGTGGMPGCYEFWGNCSNYNDGAGSYAGQCDSVFTGCTQPFSQACPGSSDLSQLGAGAPDIPGSSVPGGGSPGLGGAGSACESGGGLCLPGGSGATECTEIGGTISMTESCSGSSSGGTVCCLFGGR